MSEPLAPGTVFAGYLIERRLGSGGMGTVYAVQHPRLPRRDALKVLSSNVGSDPQSQARFIREAELVARLDHPNIVAVHDRGVSDGRLWISMQFVDGIDADQLLRRGSVPPERALHIVSSAARGLDEAHRAGLLHRDVKPANLLLESRSGRADRVFVTDFGIARALGETTALTEAGSVLATLAYAAPEQLMSAPVDHRADIYALGCTLYELLTGTKPFPLSSPVAVLRAHLQDPPPRPSTTNPGLPRAIDGVIARAMAKDPNQRYSSCAALADAALAAFSGAGEPATTQPEGPKRGRRRWIAVAVAAVVLVAAALTSVLALNANSDDTQASAPPALGSSAATSTPTTTTPSSAVSWGNYSYIAQALPGILPSSPIISGYQNMRCQATDKQGRVVAVDQPTPAYGSINCQGDQEPVDWLLVGCNANHSPTFVRPFPEIPVVGDQRWERGPDHGRIVWQDAPGRDGQPSGALLIEFDSPARNFCQLSVFGGISGQDLYDRWWPGAPI